MSLCSNSVKFTITLCCGFKHTALCADPMNCPVQLTLACSPTRDAYQRHYAMWCNHMITLPACYTKTQSTRSFCEEKRTLPEQRVSLSHQRLLWPARMQLMQYLATNMMLLIVTNITQNCTEQIITQKFVIHINTAVSEVTDILKVLSNCVLQHQHNI